MPVSPLVVVRQGDVGLTPASPQLPSLKSSFPQGPPEALSMPVSVVRPRPDFHVPPPVARQVGLVVGSGGQSPASLASPSPLSRSIGLSGKGGSPHSMGSAELEPPEAPGQGDQAGHVRGQVLLAAAATAAAVLPESSFPVPPPTAPMLGVLVIWARHPEISC